MVKFADDTYLVIPSPQHKLKVQVNDIILTTLASNP